jgi:WD40 repeat protein
MQVLMEDIRDVRDFPIKSCSEVRFSRGGHLFAAVNGSVVQIYSTYTGEYVQTLRGHNGRVTCIQWAFNDATLLSCSSDGAIYEWDMSDSKRARDFFAKGIKWHSVAAAKDCNTVYAVGDGAGPDGSHCRCCSPYNIKKFFL